MRQIQKPLASLCNHIPSALNRGVGKGGGGARAPRNLADHFTLFKSGGQIMPSHNCQPPHPDLKSYLHVCSIRLACQTCNVDIITFEWHVISSHKEIQGVSGPDKGWITVLSSQGPSINDVGNFFEFLIPSSPILAVSQYYSSSILINF